MIKWWIRKKFPLKSSVYVRHETQIGYDRYVGTVAGYGGYRVLVRISESKIRLFNTSSLALIEDETDAKV